MREPDCLGNCELLKWPVFGFFSSRTTAPLSVLPTLDWAHEVSRREDVAVMSGFQSPMEREVLDILLTGRCGIIIAMNRSIYRQVPQRFMEQYEQGRILFVSLTRSAVVRPSREQAAVRNRYIAEKCGALVFSSVREGSSLYPLMQMYKNKIILAL